MLTTKVKVTIEADNEVVGTLECIFFTPITGFRVYSCVYKNRKGDITHKFTIELPAGSDVRTLVASAMKRVSELLDMAPKLS